MLKIEWVEIPGGEFIFGLSAAQRYALQIQLRDFFEIYQLDETKQRLVESLVAKYKRAAKDENYSILSNETKEESELAPDLYSPLLIYFLAERELESIPKERKLTLPTFYIAQFPITIAQYVEFYNSSYAKHFNLIRDVYNPEVELPEMPAYMSGEIADSFAHWLGGRLPTVAEWEKAARGTDGRLYPWGNAWSPALGNFGYEYRPSYSKEKGVGLTVVDAYPGGVSPYGLWDMAGNKAEWTMTVETNSVRSYGTPLAKGCSAKGLSRPDWFEAILAREQFETFAGFRPVVSEWQRKSWQGISVPPFYLRPMQKGSA